jgi:hypothetical protein
MLVYFVAIWNILQPFWYVSLPFGMFLVIWYVFGHLVNFVMLYQEKSGNPAPNSSSKGRRSRHFALMTLTPEQQSDNGPKMQPGTIPTIVNYKTQRCKKFTTP